MSSTISKEDIEFILQAQVSCQLCGSNDRVQIHHRIFQSELEIGLQNFLESKRIRKECRWNLHSRQNLIRLCYECHHEKIHGGCKKTREIVRECFTHPITGQSVPYKKF